MWIITQCIFKHLQINITVFRFVTTNVNLICAHYKYLNFNIQIKNLYFYF